MSPQNPMDPEAEGTGLEPLDPEAEGTGLEPLDPEAEDTGLEPLDPGARWESDPGSSRYREGRLRSAQRGRLHDGAPVASGIPPVERRFSGFVIVRLSGLVPVAAAKSLAELAEALGLSGLTRTLERFGSPPSERSISVVTPSLRGKEEEWDSEVQPGSLEDLERRSAGGGLPSLSRLWSYWRVDARSLEGSSDSEPIVQLADQLRVLAEVDLAYRELAASDPGGNGGSPFDFGPAEAEELADFQLELGRSPWGVGARWLRRQLAGSAEAVVLADLEQGWMADHEDLDGALAGRDPIVGHNRHGWAAYRGDHGTAVVSQLVGRRGNRRGIVGIAEGVATVTLASHFRRPAASGVATNGHVADAIVALIVGEEPILGPGDVLLLEVQRAGQPTEVDPLDFAAIRLASASGVIVVEPAGNGAVDLDRVRTEDGRSMNRRRMSFRDSGAILVGAARAAVPHDRASFSSFGSRVDCFAWGDHVVAAGYGALQSGKDRSLYTNRFSGTSSAAPTIAGAAALIQALYRHRAWASDSSSAGRPERSGCLTPSQMRSLLGSRATGTAQGPGTDGFIGFLPDLRAVVEETLGLAASVYLRDRVQAEDVSSMPARVACSPDIVVSSEENIDPNRAFGEGSGRENRLDLSPDSRSSGSRWVCVRARNRGGAPAEDVRLRLYSAPVATLVTPDRWSELGEVAISEVPPGDTLAVSEPLEWGSSKGRDCLVAVVHHDEGRELPRPCHGSQLDWRAFVSEVLRDPRLAVRNVHRVDLPLGSEHRLAFLVNGTPEAPRAFELEVLQRLPAGARVEMSTSLGLALELSQGRCWSVERAGNQGGFRLPKQPRLPLGPVALPAAVDFPSHFRLQGAENLRAGHSLALRQLYRGQEVGRITWLFRQEK